jgi:hypothetical protein
VSCTSYPPLLTTEKNLVFKPTLNQNYVSQEYTAFLNSTKHVTKTIKDGRVVTKLHTYLSALGSQCIELQVFQSNKQLVSDKHIVCKDSADLWAVVPSIIQHNKQHQLF